MKDIIDFADYSKIEVRVGKIVSAEVPEGSNKLIKEWYTPEELVGVKTMWVVNLAPKKTPFGDSEGMLFACDTKDGKPYILKISDDIEAGSEFH